CFQSQLLLHHRTPHSSPTRRSSDLHTLAGLGTDLHEDLGRGGDTEQILSTVHRDTDDTLRGTDRFASHVLDAVDQALDDVLARADRKSTRLNSSHVSISYAVFCLKK